MAPNNSLQFWGNEKSMNLNTLVLSNIQQSPYFKNRLYELVTYHQVVHEIQNNVNHLEPWEKGSRNTSNQVGMCGGVRGVGTGGIVSTAYCLLYKLHVLKLTRNQLTGLCSRTDSPFARGIGLLYIRYTQPPSTFWEWYEQFLGDEEEIDPKAGGGNNMTFGEMVQNLLSKLEWYDTLLPRIPIPVQKDIDAKLKQFKDQKRSLSRNDNERLRPLEIIKRSRDISHGRRSRSRDDRGSMRRFHDDRDRSRDYRDTSRDNIRRSRDDRDRSREKKKNRERSRSRSRSRHHHEKKSKRSRSRSKDKKKRKKEKKHHKKSRRHSRSSSRSTRNENSPEIDNYQRDLKRELERVKKDKER